MGTTLRGGVVVTEVDGCQRSELTGSHQAGSYSKSSSTQARTQQPLATTSASRRKADAAGECRCSRVGGKTRQSHVTVGRTSRKG
jgi:hypothetical protein